MAKLKGSKTARVTKAQRKAIEAGNAKQFTSLLGLTLRALSELYPKDPSAPGLVLAWVPDKGQFYASMVRYEERMGEGKQVLVQALGATVEDTLRALVVNWHQGAKTGRELARVARKLAEPDDLEWDIWGGE